MASKIWTNHLGACDCGAEVYAQFEGAEALETCKTCKCGAPVCESCQDARERVCEECGAFCCESSAINFGDYWVCLACIRRDREAEKAELYAELYGAEVA